MNKHYLLFLFITGSALTILAQPKAKPIAKDAITIKVETLLAKMTLAEKVGQLNQYTNDRELTGPMGQKVNLTDEIRKGNVGSLLNVRGAAATRQMQEVALQSRLKIPLLFGLDVIHGYRTTFPIPLAEAASWDLPAIEQAEHIAAVEAAAAGIHWTFAPMVDIARDPRWGRIMEGSGEDVYLGSQIAAARVRGFQGKTLGDTASIMACAKHFAAYGAAVGGRDYNSVDMSNHELWETYLPPFKAAADAGAATFMNSFNDLNGIPATGNAYLQRTILKGKWNYKGFVVSDWGSIGEMVQHGVAKDKYEAANLAIHAGSDMDMQSHSYTDNLAKLVTDKKVPIALINDAVKRILRKKYEMGLFDDPFRYCDEAREKRLLDAPAHHQAAREMAAKSIVLLKNETNLLPLSATTKKIAVIGPLAKSKTDMKGFWAVRWDEIPLVSLYEGLQAAVPDTNALVYAKGCGIKDSSTTGFAEAVAAASGADVIIAAVGETFDMSGEAKSRADLSLPGVQEKLLQALHATGKPMVVLVMAGRPLVFNWTADHAPAILYTWWLGSEAGHAMADVLFGKYNPSAKLPVSFPRALGQVPYYYNHRNTGRPAPGGQAASYRSGYIDLGNTPQYAFGHGLSYTSFKYANLQLSTHNLKGSDSLLVRFTLTNTGKVKGEEIAQLYLRDVVASVARPVMELKSFRKVMLEPGQSQELTFSIGKNQLAFYNEALDWITEPGEFKLMIGAASNDVRLQDSFQLLK